MSTPVSYAVRVLCDCGAVTTVAMPLPADLAAWAAATSCRRCGLGFSQFCPPSTPLDRFDALEPRMTTAARLDYEAHGLGGIGDVRTGRRRRRSPDPRPPSAPGGRGGRGRP